MVLVWKYARSTLKTQNFSNEESGVQTPVCLFAFLPKNRYDKAVRGRHGGCKKKRGGRKPSQRTTPSDVVLMRCAKGIFAKGILGCTGFPFCGGKKGLRLPLAMGKRSETPSFIMLRPRERGRLRPFSPSQEGVSNPFSHRKRANPVHPKIPLAKIPLGQRMMFCPTFNEIFRGHFFVNFSQFFRLGCGRFSHRF